MSSDSCNGVMRAMAMLKAMRELKARKERAAALPTPAGRPRARRPSRRAADLLPKNPLAPQPRRAVTPPSTESTEPKLPPLILWDAAASKRVRNPALFEQIDPRAVSDAARSETVGEVLSKVLSKVLASVPAMNVRQYFGKIRTGLRDRPAYAHLQDVSEFSLIGLDAQQTDFARKIGNTLPDPTQVRGSEQVQGMNLVAALHRYFHDTREMELAAIHSKDSTYGDIRVAIGSLSSDNPDAFIAIQDAPPNMGTLGLVNHTVATTPDGAVALLIPRMEEGVDYMVSTRGNALVSTTMGDLNIVAVAEPDNFASVIAELGGSEYGVVLAAGMPEALSVLNQAVMAIGYTTMIQRGKANANMEGVRAGPLFNRDSITHLVILKNITNKPEIELTMDDAHPFMPALFEQGDARM